MTKVKKYLSFYEGESFLVCHCQKCLRAWRFINDSLLAGEVCVVCVWKNLLKDEKIEEK